MTREPQKDGRLKETPSQTAGPYVHIGTAPQSIGREPLPNQPGPVAYDGADSITIEGVIYDGAGEPVRDAMVEFWGADAQGRTGEHGLFGRATSDFKTGEFRFQTVKPGQMKEGLAPRIDFLIFARGINLHLHTRIYFQEDQALVEADPELRRVAPKSRATLIAQRIDGGAKAAYRFDVNLQGENETVFFDV
ncbi:protocatechuate 3,4-dioxygenase subunit alpha [Stappia sp. GBMRC 2046]|uniref:Protocatechuate 3,4-dioxygenase subunit alpha n=1 Tax=Stappia sediminis TaxID=2692190 RepID=A0A7X3LT75_9HYPH|nr:protocatechuate 3,4-dioxygenase subunit alpha [Stappia sediminis]MXN64669.1 protocatechuate 3,4-dioxygenase subunit alpha [Stappia sediminis]